MYISKSSHININLPSKNQILSTPEFIAYDFNLNEVITESKTSEGKFIKFRNDEDCIYDIKKMTGQDILESHPYTQCAILSFDFSTLDSERWYEEIYIRFRADSLVKYKIEGVKKDDSIELLKASSPTSTDGSLQGYTITGSQYSNNYKYLIVSTNRIAPGSGWANSDFVRRCVFAVGLSILARPNS